MESCQGDPPNVCIVVGQGIAGSALAWCLHWAGHQVHIVDRGDAGSASRIAAGLITPITGRRFTKAADFDECLAAAKEFYSCVEIATGKLLLERNPSVRLFASKSEQQFVLAERATPFCQEIELFTESDSSPAGFLMLNAARLRVGEFLDSTRQFFTELGQYHQATMDLASDVELTPEGVKLHRPELTAARMVFCQGYQPEANPWFPKIPNSPARGEILRVRIPSRTDPRVIHSGYWLAPDQSSNRDDDFIIGATYDRENLKAIVTEEGRGELHAAMLRLTREEVHITGHVGAVRASTKDRQPVIAVHAEYPQLAILNGMGSRAALIAPLAARRLVELISTGRSSPGKANTSSAGKPKSLTKLAHSIVRRAIRPGDTVIDATAGNGHDTCFLARCAGEKGKTIAIDIQPSAIQATSDRLEAEGIKGVQLIAGDHSVVLHQLLTEGRSVKAIMFNLGYLPGGDKQRTTMPRSTMTAIEAGLEILLPGGVMTVVAYRGHSGGQQEADVVEEVARQQRARGMTIDVIPGSSDNDQSPVLYVFRHGA